jgi:hypothetical protein
MVLAAALGAQMPIALSTDDSMLLVICSVLHTQIVIRLVNFGGLGCSSPVMQVSPMLG